MGLFKMVFSVFKPIHTIFLFHGNSELTQRDVSSRLIKEPEATDFFDGLKT